jgi:hypothetical protein
VGHGLSVDSRRGLDVATPIGGQWCVDVLEFHSDGDQRGLEEQASRFGSTR